jgi:deoxyribonuclease-4
LRARGEVSIIVVMTNGSDRSFLLGCHLSIAGGLTRAIDAAEDLGNNALQIFTHSPSVWRMKAIEDGDAAAFRERRDVSAVRYLVVHTMYLLNLATPDDALYERSVDGLIEEARRAARIGADGLVTHLGAHVGSGIEPGIERIIGALDRLAAASGEFGELRLLIENTAGAGTTVGSSFDELGSILSSLRDGHRFGVCLDTCHAFAAGYDLRTTGAVEETVERFDCTVGLDRLEMIHLNDSRFPLDSRRDRHAHIGRGEIGETGLAAVLRYPCLRDVPFLLETPKEIDGRPNADTVNLAAVRRLRKGEEPE